ncbi:MAG: enoyl-CoA hydratase [Solirubrobacterales bacterium]|nr:enoyl-CoA hydratase [Solirubrobacterales bacterium]
MSVQHLETVDCQLVDGVAWVTLNRPDALNAVTWQVGEDLRTALEDAAGEPRARAVVVTGAGRAFSSGADLRDRSLRGEDDGFDVLTILREVLNPVILRVRTLEKPVIAAVNGPAVGVGCSLALAADLIVAARSAYFLLAFVNIGLGLDGGASQSLPARVGHARAMEMALLGERIDAEQAAAWGLANRVVDDEQLRPAVTDLAGKLAAGPPGSYAAIKRTVNERSFQGFAELLDLEAVVQQERAESEDFGEGVAAFTERRPASFTGA